MAAGHTTRDLVSNRRARHNYEILDTVECGIALVGTEVKSLREAKASLQHSFADIRHNELYAVDFRIEPYSHGTAYNHDPLRLKKLLVHRRELDKLATQVAVKGCTLIPLAVYLKHGRMKLRLALCKGKDRQDKRETLRRRTADREAARAISEHRGR